MDRTGSRSSLVALAGDYGDALNNIPVLYQGPWYRDCVRLRGFAYAVAGGGGIEAFAADLEWLSSFGVECKDDVGDWPFVARAPGSPILRPSLPRRALVWSTRSGGHARPTTILTDDIALVSRIARLTGRLQGLVRDYLAAMQQTIQAVPASPLGSHEQRERDPQTEIELAVDEEIGQARKEWEREQHVREERWREEQWGQLRALHEEKRSLAEQLQRLEHASRPRESELVALRDRERLLEERLAALQQAAAMAPAPPGEQQKRDRDRKAEAGLAVDEAVKKARLAWDVGRRAHDEQRQRIHEKELSALRRERDSLADQMGQQRVTAAEDRRRRTQELEQRLRREHEQALVELRGEHERELAGMREEASGLAQEPAAVRDSGGALDAVSRQALDEALKRQRAEIGQEHRRALAEVQKTHAAEVQELRRQHERDVQALLAATEQGAEREAQLAKLGEELSALEQELAARRREVDAGGEAPDAGSALPEAQAEPPAGTEEGLALARLTVGYVQRGQSFSTKAFGSGIEEGGEYRAWLQWGEFTYQFESFRVRFNGAQKAFELGLTGCSIPADLPDAARELRLVVERIGGGRAETRVQVRS